MTPAQIAINRDYNQANDYAVKYGIKFVLEVQARAAMIESAAEKYSKFCELPASSSVVTAALDLVWGLASNIVPVLRFAQVARNAELALEIAKAAKVQASRTARVVVAAGKIHDGIKKVQDVKGTAEGLRDQGAAVTANEPQGMAELAKVDVRKRPIRDLMHDARRIVRVWSDTLDLLTDINALRLMTQDQSGESMLSIARKALPPFSILTDDELDQLELAYLWDMIGRYVAENVKVVRVSVNSRSTGEERIEGLNDTQIKTIHGLFGLLARRGGYFTKPLFLYTHQYLAHWNAGTAVEDHVRERGNRI